MEEKGDVAEIEAKKVEKKRRRRSKGENGGKRSKQEVEIGAIYMSQYIV